MGQILFKNSISVCFQYQYRHEVEKNNITIKNLSSMANSFAKVGICVLLHSNVKLT